MYKVLKAKDHTKLYKYTDGSSKKYSLENTDYYDLIKSLGQPSIPVESGDGKAQVEWIIEFQGKYFTIYDWKTFDNDYTKQELQTWSIGGTEINDEFIDELLSSLPNYSKITL